MFSLALLALNSSTLGFKVVSRSFRDLGDDFMFNIKQSGQGAHFLGTQRKPTEISRIVIFHWI